MKWRGIGLAVLVLVGALAGGVAHLPAARALAWFGPERIDAAGVKGSVWAGRAQRVAFGGPAPVTGLRWDISAWRLLIGQLAGTARFDFSGTQINGEFAVTPGGRIELSRAKLEGPAAPLVELARIPALALEGRLIARLESGAWNGQRPQSVSGRFQWDEARLIAPMQLELGRVRGRIQPGDQGDHRLKLANQGGQVKLDGEVVLKRDMRYRVALTLEPTEDAPASVGETLNQFLPRRDGRFVVERRGQL